MAEEENQAENQGENKTKTLYIWGLGKDIDQPTVKEEFGKHATIQRVTIIKDKATGLSKGFGYVECESPEDATNAMKEMDGKIIGENPVRIKYSFSEKPEWLTFLESKGKLGDGPRPSRGGFRGRGRGRGNFDEPRADTGFGFRELNRGPWGEDDGGMDGGFSDPYERRPLADPYERRPLADPYERRPLADPYERRPLADPYERRPLADPYERRSLDPYERRPLAAGRSSELYDERHLPPRQAPASADPYSRGRDIYDVDRRGIIEDRKDLYRPSERLGPGHLPGMPREEIPRSRSPIDRSNSAVIRDPYERDFRERAPIAERVPAEIPSANGSSRVYNYYEGNRDPNAPPSYTSREGYPSDNRYPDSRSQEPGGRPLNEGRSPERLPERRAEYNDPYAQVTPLPSKNLVA